MIKKIAFVISFNELKNWSGGHSYFKNLFSILKNIKEFEYHIYTDSLNYIKDFKLDKYFKVHEKKFFKRGNLLYFLRKLTILITGKDFFLFNTLLKDNITTISHRRLFINKKIKTIGWIPDLQHKIKPEFFDNKYLAKREKYLTEEIKNTNKIFVSSYQIKREFKKFYKLSKKILPLRIYSEMKFKKTKLKKFILFPAQFWEHKNHKFLINAGEIIKKEKINIKIVFCGKIENYKNKKFYETINKEIKQKNLNKIIINLGEVSLKKLNSLQNECIALVNPSYYEGWSTINEESRSKQKFIFLSNISGHKEQKNHGSIYFNLSSPKDFIKKLKSFLNKKLYKKNKKFEKSNKKYFLKRYNEIKKILKKEYI